MKREIALYLTAGLLLCGAVCGAIYSITEGVFLRNMCGNEIFEQIPSPSGSHKAIIFERDCGATTGFSTQVSVLPPHQALTNADKGNAFICDHGTGREDARIKWLDERHLEVQYQSAVRVFLQESQVSGVTVRYTALP